MSVCLLFRQEPLDFFHDVVDVGLDGGVFNGAGEQTGAEADQVQQREIPQGTADPRQKQQRNRRQRQVETRPLRLDLLSAEEERARLVFHADEGVANDGVTTLQIRVPIVGGEDTRHRQREQVIGERDHEAHEGQEGEERGLHVPNEEEEESDDAENHARVEGLLPVDHALSVDQNLLPIIQEIAHARRLGRALVGESLSVTRHD